MLAAILNDSVKAILAEVDETKVSSNQGKQLLSSSPDTPVNTMYCSNNLQVQHKIGSVLENKLCYLYEVCEALSLAESEPQ